MKRLKTLALLPALLVFLGAAGCALPGTEPEPSSLSSVLEEEGDSEYPVQVGGAELESRPAKVVSLAPALTEKLYDLGMEDRVAGVSDYDDYPEEMLSLPGCGTAQLPDLEAILALEPHLLLTEAELPEEAARTLAEAGVPVAVFPHAESVSELLDTYVGLARLLDGETSGRMIGESVAGDYRQSLNDMRRAIEPVAQQGRKKALYLMGLPNCTVATGGTFENDLLNAICLDNIAEPYTGWTYPPEERESAEGRAAFAGLDLIFMDSKFVGIHDLEQDSYFQGLPATIQDRYLYISSLLLERQSVRSLEQLAAMAAYAYPEAVPEGGFDVMKQEPAPSSSEAAQSEGEDMLAAVDEMYRQDSESPAP